MIETILAKLGALILTPVVFLSTFFAQPVETPVVYEEPLGVALPSGTALFETSLASPITTSALTMTLVANSIRGGGSLSGYQCFTIDEGSAQAEFVCGTVSGTSVTGLERGLSPADGITQDTDLQFSHRRGASVKITDFPLIQRLRSQASGSGTYEDVLSYAPGVTPSGSDEIADVGYVLSAISGTSTLAFDKLSPAGTAGETMGTGTIVYFKKSDQRWYKLDVDDFTNYVDTEVGCTAGAGTTANGISGGIILRGLCPQVNLTAGANYFASSTAGATSTATTSQSIGVARSTTQLYFNPDLIDSTVYGTTTFVGTTTFNGIVTGIQRVTEYTSSSTYTKPSGLKYIELEMWGAGGGGAAGGGDVSGGGGGAYAKFRVEASLLGATSSIVIGTGGAGGVSSAAGGAGSSTMFTLSGSTLIAYGGAGGALTQNGSNGGGIVSHGTTTETGQTASATPHIYKGYGQTQNIVPTKTYWGGAPGGGCNGSSACAAGGDSIYGGAGGGGARTNANGSGGTSNFGGNGGAGVTSGTATAGSVPGGGGGAASGSGTAGAGANGKVRITEYF